MTLALSQKKLQLLILLGITVAFAVIYLIFVPHTFAQTATPSPTTVREELREFNQTVRDANKIKVCQTHERNIKNRADHLQNLVNKMFANFDKVAIRIENYYTQKLVPQGKTLSSYDSLVADIATKKKVVNADMNKAKADIAGFSCTTSTNPKTDLTTYRIDMQTVKKDLQNYRTSIKNLIVAVRGLAGESSSPSASPITK